MAKDFIKKLEGDVAQKMNKRRGPAIPQKQADRVAAKMGVSPLTAKAQLMYERSQRTQGKQINSMRKEVEKMKDPFTPKVEILRQSEKSRLFRNKASRQANKAAIYRLRMAKETERQKKQNG